MAQKPANRSASIRKVANEPPQQPKLAAVKREYGNDSQQRGNTESIRKAFSPQLEEL